MSNNYETLTCLECGEDITEDLFDEHMVLMHNKGNIRNLSKAERRLQTKRTKKSTSVNIIAGVVITIIILFALSLFIYQPADKDSNDDLGFQETEDPLDVTTKPKDDSSSGNGNQNQGSGNGNSNDNDNTGNGNNSNEDNGTDIDPEPEILVVQIPTSDITTNAKWYQYDSDGVEIRFFAVRSNDNEIHVAFDACDVCYDAKKGYVQDGIKMVCNNCGKSFPIKAIGTENIAGGCWPSYLPMTIEDDYVIIEIADLEEKLYMFE
jgi:uncharacterized membrane protein